jgi:hypothetical protein
MYYCLWSLAHYYTGPLTEQDETVDGDENTYHDKAYGHLPSPGITLEELQTMVPNTITASTTAAHAR